MPRKCLRRRGRRQKRRVHLSLRPQRIVCSAIVTQSDTRTFTDDCKRVAKLDQHSEKLPLDEPWKVAFDQFRPHIVKAFEVASTAFANYLPKHGVHISAKDMEKIKQQLTRYQQCDYLIMCIDKIAEEINSIEPYKYFVDAAVDFCKFEPGHDHIKSLLEVMLFCKNLNESSSSLPNSSYFQATQLLVPVGPGTNLYQVQSQASGWVQGQLNSCSPLYKKCWYQACSMPVRELYIHWRPQLDGALGLHRRKPGKSCGNLVKYIIATDALCTHVPIARGLQTVEEIVSLLNVAILYCQCIEHRFAVVLILRLKRRIACIYFREGRIVEAKQVLSEARGYVSMNSSADVGKADFYWLLAWIDLFEAIESGKMHNLVGKWFDDQSGIRANIYKSLDVASQLDCCDGTNQLRNAYVSRIACYAICIHLLMMELAVKYELPLKTCNGETVPPSSLEQEAQRIRTVNVTEEDMTKRDLHLVPTVDKWLNKSAHIAELDSSNVIFTKWSDSFNLHKNKETKQYLCK